MPELDPALQTTNGHSVGEPLLQGTSPIEDFQLITTNGNGHTENIPGLTPQRHRVHDLLKPPQQIKVYESIDDYINQQEKIMLSAGHVDLPWLWLMIEALHESAATDEATLDNMDRYPEMTYAKSSTFPLKWTKKEHPDIFKRLQEKVREGRLEMVCGMVIEPGCNNEKGESRARQYVYGQRFLAANFVDKDGYPVTAQVGSDVDAFGHSDTAQIDAKSGIILMPEMRPEDQDNPRPQFTIRKSKSGYKVIGFKFAHDYNLIAERMKIHLKMSQETMRASHFREVILYGTGDRGGGATRETLDEKRRIQADPFGPKLIDGTWKDLLDTLDADALEQMEVHTGPIERHAAGTYSNFLDLKNLNRKAEWDLLSAEKASIMAAIATGREPSHAELTSAWEDNLLVGQFHDSISGTCIKEAYIKDILPLFNNAILIANKERDAALHNIASNIKIDEEKGMTPYVIFNTTSDEMTGPVEFEVNNMQTFHIVDENGEEVPFQVVDKKAKVPWHQRVLVMPTVAAFGWKTLRVRPGEGKKKYEPMQVEYNPLDAPDHYKRDDVGCLTIDNGQFELSIDTQTGYIKNLYDKKNIAAAFRGDALVPTVFTDKDDTWGHAVGEFNQYAGQFRADSVEVVEQGHLRSVVKIVSKYKESKLTQYITMYKDNPQIDVKSTLDWQQQKQVLKLLFSLDTIHSKATFEGPYSLVEREQNGLEVPTLDYFDISGESRDQNQPYGVTVLGLHSAHVKTTPRGTPDAGITIVRSPEWANHYPNENNSTVPEDHMDQGIHEYTVSFVPHTDAFFRAESDRHAAELHEPLIAQRTTYHPKGTLEQTKSMIEVKQKNVRVSALKRSEDGKGKIMRIYETIGLATQANVDIAPLGRSIATTLSPTEVKTIYIPDDPNEEWYEMDIPELRKLDQPTQIAA